MKISSKYNKKSLFNKPICNLNNNLMNYQNEFDKIIKTRYLDDFIIPLKNKNFDLIIKNIENKRIIEDENILFNYKFSKLPSAQLAYSTIITISNILQEMNKNDFLTKLNNDYLITSNKSNQKITTVLTADSDISSQYLFYIEKYGIPEDGIFEEDKLNEFITTNNSDILFT